MVAHTQTGPSKFLGVQIGSFGLFGALVMSFALAITAFFGTCFVAIFGILIYNGAGHHLDFADSYQYIALPVGLAVLAVSLIVLISLWLRTKFGNH